MNESEPDRVPMKNIIRVEEAAMFGLAVLMFAETNFLWWLFLVLLLVPDISMLGYLFSSKIGAFMYNLFHHKGIAIFIYFVGYVAEERYLELAGAILFGHSSLDRIFGYGLKFTDNFKHTHLGRIGQK